MSELLTMLPFSFLNEASDDRANKMSCKEDKEGRERHKPLENFLLLHFAKFLVIHQSFQLLRLLPIRHNSAADPSATERIKIKKKRKEEMEEENLTPNSNARPMRSLFVL
jgi:hypothetical protein